MGFSAMSSRPIAGPDPAIYARVIQEVVFEQLLTPSVLLPTPLPEDWMAVNGLTASAFTQQVFLLDGASAYVSSNYGGNIIDGTGLKRSRYNRVLRVNDADIYSVLEDGIYVSTDGAGLSFTLLQAYTAKYGPNQYWEDLFSGIYFFINKDQSENLTGWFYNTSAQYVCWIYNLTASSYTEYLNTTMPLETISIGGQGGEVWFDNAIYWIVTTGSGLERVYRWDPFTKLITFHALGALYNTSVPAALRQLCVAGYNELAIDPVGRLWRTYMTTTYDVRLAYWEGVDWADSGIEFPGLGANTVAIASYEMLPTVFFCPFTTDMVVFYIDNGNTGTPGWRVKVIPAPYIGIQGRDVTDVVMPTNLQSTNTPAPGTASSDTGKRWRSLCDNEVIGSRGNRSDSNGYTVLLYHSEGSNVLNFCTGYFWRGSHAVLHSFGLTGINQGMWPSKPENAGRGGERYMYANEKYAKIIATSKAQVNGNELISFKAYGGGTVAVQFKFLKGNEYLQMALAGTATGGGVRVANEVIAVPADGTTLHTIEWDYTSQNVPSEQVTTRIVELVP